MAVSPGLKSFERGKSRLFASIWLEVALADALSISAMAAAGSLDINDNNFVCVTGCQAFPFWIGYPTAVPIKEIIANRSPRKIEIEIRESGWPETGPRIAVLALSWIRIQYSSMIFVRFYEQHVPFLRATFGKSEKWPMIFRFAWAIRNGMVHHGGHINYTDPSGAPVTWHAFTYAPSEKVKPPIFGDHFSPGDLLILLLDLSDALDAIGAPLPPEFAAPFPVD
jgi:hypothetical protein